MMPTTSPNEGQNLSKSVLGGLQEASWSLLGPLEHLLGPSSKKPSKKSIKMIDKQHIINRFIGYVTIDTQSNPESETLKYRYRHMAKLDLALSKNKWTFGTHLHYNSFMENVDKLFESGAFNAEVLDIYTLADANIFDMGIKSSRERLNSGDFIADIRVSYVFTKNISAQFLIENAFNREYQMRPGSIGAPRLFSLKLKAEF